MPSLLDPDRWQELEPELRAGKLISEAREMLLPVNATAARDLERAMMRLHPASRDPKALEEFEARKRGEYSSQPATIVQGYTQDDVDAAVSRALERRDREQREREQREREQSNA